MEIIQWLVGWFTYLGPPTAIVVIAVYAVILGKRNTDAAGKSVAYSKEMVGLLKEIRDLLKR